LFIISETVVVNLLYQLIPLLSLKHWMLSQYKI